MLLMVSVQETCVCVCVCVKWRYLPSIVTRGGVPSSSPGLTGSNWSPPEPEAEGVMELDKGVVPAVVGLTTV